MNATQNDVFLQGLSVEDYNAGLFKYHTFDVCLAGAPAFDGICGDPDCHCYPAASGLVPCARCPGWIDLNTGRCNAGGTHK